MNYLKRVITAAAGAGILLSSVITAQANLDISVMAHSLRGSVPEIISFNDHEPVQVNNTTLVPVRDLAGAAGMSVEWDQPTQTATITLEADSGSDEPVKQYAAELINKVGGYGLELAPQNISASLKLDTAEATIKYNFADSEGDTVSIGKTVEISSAATLVDDRTLMVPVRDTMELFGLEVVWSQSAMAVKISIPDYIKTPSGLSIMAQNKPQTVSYEVQDYDAPVYEEAYSDAHHGAYLGRFKITHYCPCAICNGGYGAHTAWADFINPGTTIAVNPSIIAPMSWVYVDGYGLRRAEDTGGGIGEYHIDMAVPTHAMALSMGVVYRDVYLAD